MLIVSSDLFSVVSGVTRRDRTGDLLITKKNQTLHTFCGLPAIVPGFNNLGNLLSLEQDPEQAQAHGVLTQF